VLDRLPPPVRQMMLDNGRTVRETDTPFPVVSRAELGRLRLPTLMVHGQTGALWLRAIAEMGGAAIPGCETVTIPGSGHYPHFQNPAAFNAALARFLQRVDGTP